MIIGSLRWTQQAAVRIISVDSQLKNRHDVRIYSGPRIVGRRPNLPGTCAMFKAGEIKYHSKVHRCPTNHGMLKKISKTWELKFKEYDKSIEIPANG